MNSRINIASLVLWIIISFVFYFHSVGEASSFPFRSVDIGDALPAVTLHDPTSQQDVSLGRFIGKPLLLFFFGADNPDKKKRAVRALKAVNKVAPFAADKGIVILVVNAQGDSAETINEVVAASGIHANVYLDVNRSAYGGFGVFVMPSVLLVSAGGEVAAGLGYSRDLDKKIKGEMEIMLGEKTRDQVEAALHPKMVEKSAEEKGARRHFKMGLTMIERGLPDSAMREFKKAISLESGMSKAYVYLGCLQLDEGDIDGAKVSLRKGLELEPDFTAGLICQARIKAGVGDLDGAIDDLGAIMMRNYRNDQLHYVLGTMLEEKTDLAGAMREYRKAYELLGKKSRY